MRSVIRPSVRGACLIATVAAAACAHGGGAAPGQPPYAPSSPSPAPTAPAGAAAPIDTVGLPRVRFARGTTSGILDDSLAAGATRSYLVGARQGQVMLAHAIAWPVAERLHPPPEPAVRVFSAAANGVSPRSGTVSTTTGGPDCARPLTCAPSVTSALAARQTAIRGQLREIYARLGIK